MTDHYQCETSQCTYPDLPADTPVNCICAGQAIGKIDDAWLDTWRAEKLRRDASTKTRNAGMLAVARELEKQS